MSLFKYTENKPSHGSCTIPHPQTFQYKDYKTNIPALKKKKLPTKVEDKIRWFHETKTTFPYRYSSGFKKIQMNIQADSDELTYEVEKMLNRLSNYNTCLFGITANKYKDCKNYTIAFPYIIWEEIDLMGNIKIRKEKISSLATYVKSFNIYTPNEKVLKGPISFDVTISEDPEDKYELFSHLGFCGSCQHQGGNNGNAQGYFDSFLNGAMLYAEFRYDGKFEGRLFIRIVYDENGNQYLALDRTYYGSTLSSRQSLAIEKLVVELTKQGYKVVDNRGNTCFRGMPKVAELLLTSPRPAHPRRHTCYYNNSGYTAITKDHIMYDVYPNAYLYVQK